MSEFTRDSKHNLKVVAERRTVAVRIYGQSGLEHIKLELKILQHLESMDFESPRTLPGTDRQLLQQWEGYWVCASEFIPGVMVDTIRITPKLVGDAGRLVSSFQNYGIIQNRRNSRR